MSFEIKKCPTSFDGNLVELYEGWARHLLIDREVVEEFHEQLCAYLDSVDPLYLVRMVSRLERGKTIRTEYGAHIRPTDNSPAWWIHYQLFSGGFKQYSSFAAFIEATPCFLFDVRLPDSINRAGWHVAHIFDVKNGNVEYHHWDRNELKRRMVRNIHPCNYFFVPKRDWQRHGGHPTVIAFFTEQFESRYRTIWKDFLKMVDAVPNPEWVDPSTYRYSFKPIQPVSASRHGGSIHTKTRYPGCVTSYTCTRLSFRADVIEPLAMDDTFCIETEDGTFVMTRREFYETFPGVLNSKSYRQNGIYHYPKPPRKALPFMVTRAVSILRPDQQ